MTIHWKAVLSVVLLIIVENFSILELALSGVAAQYVAVSFLLRSFNAAIQFVCLTLPRKLICFE